MATPKETVQAYGDAWNELDEAKRRALLERAWADDATYTDPSADLHGREALIAHIGAFHKDGMPGARIIPSSGVDEHHGRLRFTWRMEGADGSTIIEGIDFGELAGDGRLQRIVGFFGPPPDVN